MYHPLLAQVKYDVIDRVEDVDVLPLLTFLVNGLPRLFCDTAGLPPLRRSAKIFPVEDDLDAASRALQKDAADSTSASEEGIRLSAICPSFASFEGLEPSPDLSAEHFVSVELCRILEKERKRGPLDADRCGLT